MRLIVLFVMSVAISSCGNRTELRPRTGESLPVKPLFAPATPTVGKLLTPDTQARPQRSDEQLNRSQERRDDKFDLPPPG
jgi:hypothetical protein